MSLSLALFGLASLPSMHNITCGCLQDRYNLRLLSPSSIVQARRALTLTATSTPMPVQVHLLAGLPTLAWASL
jgi:hypothetical protein